MAFLFLKLKYHTTTTIRLAKERPLSVKCVCVCYLSDTRVIRYDGASLLNFSSSSQPPIDVSYEQLKKQLVSRSSVVIDVREPWELREYGNIQGSINVPRKSVNVLIHVGFCIKSHYIITILYPLICSGTIEWSSPAQT